MIRSHYHPSGPPHSLPNLVASETLTGRPIHDALEELQGAGPAWKPCSETVEPRNKGKTFRFNRKSQMNGVIIGAGLAGTLFAHLLREHHPSISFTLLDARSRTGGRVLTKRPDLGGPALELGAEYVNDDHTTVKRWCSELGIELLPAYPDAQGAPKMAFLSDQGLRTDFRSILLSLTAAVIRDRPRLRNSADRAHFDNLSAQSYVNSLGLRSEDTQVLLLFLENEQCIKPAQMSASFLIEFMDFGRMAVKDNSLFARGDDRFLIANGSSSLIRALEKPIESAIRLDASLEAISVTPAGRYDLHFTNHHSLLADFVVLAIPGSAFKRIEFDPDNHSLKELGVQLQGLNYSEVEKIIIELDGDQLEILTEFQQVLSHEARGLVWQTGMTNRQEHPSQIALYRRRDDNCSTEHSFDRTVEDLLKALHNARPNQSNGKSTPSLLSYSRKQWSEGGWSQPTLGYGADFCHGVPIQVGHIFNTGEHMAADDPQTMEGALQATMKAYEKFEETFFSSSLRSGVSPADKG